MSSVERWWWLWWHVHVPHTCQLSLFNREEKVGKRSNFTICPYFCKNLSVVMYRNFRNVPIFMDFPPICPYFLGFRVGKYGTCLCHVCIKLWMNEMKNYVVMFRKLLLILHMKQMNRPMYPAWSTMTSKKKKWKTLTPMKGKYGGRKNGSTEVRCYSFWDVDILYH